MKNGKIKLLEGGLIGAALGVAAGIFMTSTSTGKKLTNDLKDKSADFYAYLAPRLKKIKKMGEADFKVFVKNAAVQYSKAKKLTVEESSKLMGEAEKVWQQLQKHFK